MTWLVVGAAVVVAAGIALAIALASSARRDYAARLEVVPGTPSAAPRSWAGSHTPAARMHRRLGDAVRSMRDQPALAGAVFVAQREVLEQEALRIDERLIAFDRLPGGEVGEIEPLVSAFEEAVTRLVTATLDDPATHETVLRDAGDRLEALRLARAEVEQIDRAQRGEV